MPSVLRTNILGALMVSTFVLGSSLAAAQQAELAGGTGVSLPLWDATFTSRYSPPLALVAHQSTASQDVVLDPDKTALVWVSLGWLSRRGIGIETHVDYRRASLRGVNGPYAVSLRYVSRPPPTSEPVPVFIDTSTDWPGTTGHVWQATATVSVTGRIGRADRTNLRLLLGGGVTRLGGRFEPIGYSTYRLGGHSVLVDEERRVSMHMTPAAAAGLSGGAELDMPLGRHAAFVAGWRLFLPTSVDVRVEADGFAASDQPFSDIDPVILQRTLAPVPVSVRPVTSDLLVGLRARF
jgi:hypothetical protein